MTDKLKEAIEVLKKNRERDTMLKRKYQPNAGEKYYNERSDTEEAIDTVVAELEKPLQTDEQIEAYALENILANDSVVAFREMSQWITGATWMRNKMRG